MRIAAWMTGTGIAAAVAFGSAGAASAEDAAAGKAMFGARCGGCHSAEAAKSGPAGPSLKGVYGRRIASLPDFAYSAALKAKAGTWTAPELDAFLSSPVKFAPGGKMYAAVTDAKDRASLIAYLKTAK